MSDGRCKFTPPINHRMPLLLLLLLLLEMLVDASDDYGSVQREGGWKQQAAIACSA
jgi:hypothetical protein